MIFTKDLENSVVLLLNRFFPTADIFRRNATQTKKDKPTFIVNVEMNATTEFKDYQRKDVEIIVQYFINDRIEFNKDVTNIRDVLESEVFINSIPIVDNEKNVVKYLLVKSSTATILDDILSFRMISDFVDDVIVTNPAYDLIGELHLKRV